MKTASIAILMALYPLAVQAHDLWIERQEGTCTLLYGHRHSEHAGSDRVPYAAEAVRSANLILPSGAAEPLPQPEASPFQFPCREGLICILFSTGYWSKTPYGTENLPRTEVRMPVRSWLSLEGIKHIATWSDSFTVPFTTDLELVPLNDPLQLEPGDKLRLLVALERKPAPGAIVTYDGKPRGKSGADGRVNVRIRHTGGQRIAASLILPATIPQCDEIVHSTVLTFDLEPKR